MNDKIEAWLKAKKALEDDPDAFDPAYRDEENCNLLEEAQRIFEALLKN